MSPDKLQKLIHDVFNPQLGESVLVCFDEPANLSEDNGDWKERRVMAAEWYEAFMGTGVKVLPLTAFSATGSHNADIVDDGLHRLIARANIVVAMTEFSATAPLARLTRDRTDLRVASMPGVLRRMEITALAADYHDVARKAHWLRDQLNLANGAHIVFNNGDHVYFDLRFRTARADDGLLHADKQGLRLINLPSGEGFIVPNEGEAEPSLTSGIIPVGNGQEEAFLHIMGNQIESVSGDSAFARSLDAVFLEDSARRNIAELGLGCNESAIVTGNVLEDEKAGMHWAYGRSDHLGGIVGVETFCSPDTVVHQDIVYARGCPFQVDSLILEGESEFEIIRHGAYCWPEKFS